MTKFLQHLETKKHRHADDITPTPTPLWLDGPLDTSHLILFIMSYFGRTCIILLKRDISAVRRGMLAEPHTLGFQTTTLIRPAPFVSQTTGTM